MRKTHLLVAFGIGTVLTLLLICLSRARIFSLLETVTYDARFVWRPNRDLSAKIVCVAIDENSFAYFKGIDPKMATWPWSPAVFARVIDHLTQWGAKVIGLDKLFSEPDIRPPPHPDMTAEQVLAQAIQSHGRVVLACKQEAKILGGDQGRIAKITIFTGPSGETAVLGEVALIGSINVPLDTDQGLRRIALEFRHGGKKIPSFAVAVAESSLGLRHEETKNLSPHAFQIGDRVIPLDDRGYMPINFTGKRVPSVSLAYVWDGDSSLLGFDPEMFRDAIVLIGSYTAEQHDLFRVPHSRAKGFSVTRTLPGVEIQAQAVNTILSRDFLRPVGGRMRILITLVCGMFVTICCSVLSVQLGVVAFLAGIVAYAAASVWCFSARNLILPMAHPILTMFLAGTGVSSYRYVREAIEKRFLKDIFSKTTDEKLVNMIIENPHLVTLGGEHREATILFSDIRNYSGLSQGMDPKDLIDLLNEYFAAWTDVIFRNGGMIDKFMGDALMAVFGAPIASETHAYDACRAAIEMQEELERLRQRWRTEKRRTFDIGVGIHTGRLVFGALGSEKRFSYTCIGDAVNIAARIEGINKQYGTTILISEDTYARVNDEVIARSRGKNQIRGREGTVELFEVVGLKHPASTQT